MTSEREHVHVHNVLQKIDDLLDGALPSGEKIIDGYVIDAENNKHPSPPSIGVTKDLKSDGFIWRASADLMWAICERVDALIVAKPGEKCRKVLTRDFGCPPAPGKLRNQYFDISTAKTIAEEFVVVCQSGSRSGSIGENVFLHSKDFKKYLPALAHCEGLDRLPYLDSARISAWMQDQDFEKSPQELKRLVGVAREREATIIIVEAADTGGEFKKEIMEAQLSDLGPQSFKRAWERARELRPWIGNAGRKPKS